MKGYNDMRYRIVLIFCALLIYIEFMYAQKSSDNSHQRKVTIGMIGKMANNPVFVAAYSGAQLAAKELSIKYNVDIVVDWQTPVVESVEEQAAAIGRFSRSKVDAIAIACSDANYLTQTIDEAVTKGIPIICFDSDAPKSKRFAYYGADDIEFGRMLMKELANKINEKGTIAVLAGNKNALNLQRRLQGIKEELKKHPRVILSQDNIFYNLDIPERASEKIQREQKANPNITGWILITSSSLLVKNSFKWEPGEVKVVAGQAVPAELEYVKSGFVQSLVGINCFQLGYKSIEIVLDKIVKNKTPNDPLIYSPLTAVKQNNVDEWSLNWKKWLLKEAVNR
jgi:ribose transport system substrate-binding protein